MFGEDDAARFRINADFELFKNSGSVRVDNVELTTEQYTATSGSTIITLNKEFTDTLSAGEHTIQTIFDDGGIATARFTVVRDDQDSDRDPEPDPEPEPESDPDSDEGDDGPAVPQTDSSDNDLAVPNTGGNTNDGNSINPVILCILPIIVSAGVLIYKKKFGSIKHRVFDK